MWGTSVCNFPDTAQSTESAIGQKFAQSGHPAEDLVKIRQKKKVVHTSANY
jgi:hypothetical protein